MSQRSKALKLVLSLAVLASMFTASPVLAASFNDVPSSHQFYQYIEDIAELGIVSGLGGNYYPDRTLSRAELTKIVIKAANKELGSSSTRAFADVDIDSEFFQYINAAAQLGIVNGYANGNFGPNDPVTRSQATKILVKAFDFTTDTTGAPHFIDVTASSEFYPYIETAYNLGIIAGQGRTFWPSSNMTRGQMAKVVSLALTGGQSSTTYTMNFVGSYPYADVALTQSTSDKLRFTFSSLPELENGFMYEAWLVLGDEVESGGKFNVDSAGEMINAAGKKIGNVLDTNLQIEDYEGIGVTIEPNDDRSTDPSGTVVLDGVISTGGSSAMSFPYLNSNISGKAYVSGSAKNLLNLQLTGLSSLTDIGMRYEALVWDEDKYVSLGTFDAKTGITNFHGEYKADLTKVGKILVSIESDSDDSTDPYLVILSTTVDTTDGDTEDEDWGTCEFDESIYDGLTTESTSESIICRTVEERDETADIIVQAYPSAEGVGAIGEIAVIVKVSDLLGEPIDGLDLKMTQTSGLEGEVGDPAEVGNSGIYIGTFLAPGDDEFSISSDDAVLKITASGSNDEDFLPIEVPVKMKSSDRRGTPKTMEVDVTREEVTVHQDDRSVDDQVIVIATLLDADHYTVEGSNATGYRSSIKLNGSSSRNDNMAPDEKEGNMYLYELDLSDLYDDNDDVEVTVSEDFQIEFYDRSSDGAYLPIISDTYEVKLNYIPEEEEEDEE